MRRSLFLLSTAFVIAACGARQQLTTHPSQATNDARSGAAAQDTDETPAGSDQPETRPHEPTLVDLEPIRIEVVGRDQSGAPELEAFDARSLLDAGNAAMAEDRYDSAIASYQRLLAVFPDSRLAPSAIYNIGLAHEAKGDHDAAIRQYRLLARNNELGRDAIDAHMRIGGVLAELERWAEARQALQEVLARPDLTHADTIEGMARLGYVAIQQNDYTAAETILRDAIAHYQKLTTSLDTNYFVAMSYYYLAQIPHLQFQAIPMRLPDEQLKKDLEAKAALVALAYDRYLEALKIQNPRWATASGYQISQIYKEFWDDIVLAPIPTQLSPEAAEYYQREVHDRVRIFLDKALSGHSKNIELAEAYKTSNEWSEASRERAAEIARILDRESRGELVTPRKRQGAGPMTAEPTEPREYIPAPVLL
jgi:TolA-binding protein